MSAEITIGKAAQALDFTENKTLRVSEKGGQNTKTRLFVKDSV